MKGSVDVADLAPRRSSCWPACAAGRWPAPTPAPATGWPSPAYLGRGDRFDQAVADFATAYADQNERDHRRLLEAIGAGEVQAEKNV